MIGIAVQVHGHVVMVREIVILIPNVLVHWSVEVTIVVTEVWTVVPMVHTPQVLAQVLAQVPAVHMARQVLQDHQDPLDHQGHLVTMETLEARVTLEPKVTRGTREILVHKVQLAQLAQGVIQDTRETKGTRATKAILEQLGLKV